MVVPSQKKLKMVEEAITKDTDLPEGWEYPLLGDLVRITQGNSKLTKKMYSANGKYTAFSGSGPDGFLEFWEHEGEAIILSSVGARCGKCFKASGKWSAIANTAIIKPYSNDPTLFSYIFYLINNEDFWPKSGSAQPFVQTGLAQRASRVPMPPLAEQQRIISKLKELFQRANTTHQYLVKVQAILKRFRQAVLAAACSGRLTADWRAQRNLEIERWAEAILKDVAQLRLGKMLDKAKNVGKPTRYLRNLNVRWFSLDLSPLSKIRATPQEQKELGIRDGDLLVCEGGNQAVVLFGILGRLI